MSRFHENIWGAGLILFICLVSFGLQTSGLGFYWDDYASMYLYQKSGAQSLQDLFSGQARPVAGWLGAWMWQTFETDPLGWHAVNFVLYLLSVLLFWRSLRVLWPAYPTQTLLIALLFAVYPSYQLRPIPISFYLVSPLVLFLFSFWLSLIAAQKRSLSLSLAAAALIPVYQLIYEQNLGYELLRPIAILAVLWQETAWQKWRNYAGSFFKIWIPFPLVTLGILIYRFILFQPDSTYADYNQFGDLNLLLLLKMSVAAPIKMLTWDWAAVPWRVFAVENVDVDRSGMMAVLFVGAAVLYFWKFQDGRIQKGASVLAVSFLSIGTISVLLLSVHLVGRVLDIGFNSRWALVPSPLAALVVGLVVPRVVRSPYLGQLLLLLLVVLGVAVQVGVNQIYAADWELRENLWQQLRWRAPHLKPDTMLIMILPPDYLAFGRTITDYEITAHSNLYYADGIYPAVVGTDDRLVVTLLANGGAREGVWSDVISGSRDAFRGWNYDLDNAIVFAYNGGCLHMADEHFRLQSLNFPAFHLLARYSHTEQIPESSFSENPSADWCFYYQRIQGALQWNQIPLAEQLVDEARSVGVVPVDGHWEELMPLIETYNRVGRYEEAEALIHSVALLDEYAQNALCERLTMQLSDKPDVLQAQLRLLPLCLTP